MSSRQHAGSDRCGEVAPGEPAPLEGVLVVALEQAVAAPFATRQLADLGARVIKVERPGRGDFARDYDRTVNGMASHFVWLNRSKESITLDIKQPDDRLTLDRLIERADVFIQNLAPDSGHRLGVTAAELTARHPHLVSCDISGYGAGGPYSARKAYDLVIQAEAGLMSITGTPEQPSKVGISIADIATGMYAYSGILAALLHRRQTGRGGAVEISMLEALGEWMGYPYLYSRYGGVEPPRTAASHATIAPYGPVTTATGETITLGLQNEREWAVFCTVVLERPELADDSRFISNSQRVENTGALTAISAVTLGALPLPEVEERLAQAGIAFAHQRSLAEFSQHPQLAARRRWAEVNTPAGPVEVLLPPVSAGWRTSFGPVPAIGEQTAEILAWLDADADAATNQQLGHEPLDTSPNTNTGRREGQTHA